MHLVLSADVTVTGKSTFTNLADAPSPAQDLVGIAQSASQGAITARQLETRPIMRPGEVLETVPGVVISQHSGEGKANQYYLRGFNLDHGTDFATTVAGMPVNMPTHGHGHGYSDLNFLIPELASGVQFSKGPYFAEHGDFATAGTANINYTNTLARPIVRVGGGSDAFGRVLLAAAPAVGGGTLLGALELEHSDGPWERPDDLRKFNGVVRYSRGDAQNGVSATLMGYHATWNSTDQIPARAIDDGRIGRFGLVDASDGGESSRYSASFEWQRTQRTTPARGSPRYGLKYDLDLFSNFTYFLDDPVNGDQFQQTDHRFVSGAQAHPPAHRPMGGPADRRTRSACSSGTTTSATSACITRENANGSTRSGRTRCSRRARAPSRRTKRNGRRGSGRSRGFESTAIASAWTPGSARTPGPSYAGLVSPKGGAVFGPFARTEIYVNAGLGFHSNDARGATITVDPVTGEPASRVTPLARATGAEVGVQNGAHSARADDGHRVDARPRFRARVRRRRGDDRCRPPEPPAGNRVDHLLLAHGRGSCSTPTSRCRARASPMTIPAGDHIPGAVATVVSAGATIDTVRNVFGSVRWRYFGPRALVEDNSIRSKATSLVNLTAGYKLTRIGARRARCVQSLQRERQRHRLLLHVAPTGGAGRRHRRFPCASGCTTHGATQSDCGILTVDSRQSSVVNHSPQSQSSVVSSSRQSESAVRSRRVASSRGAHDATACDCD